MSTYVTLDVILNVIFTILKVFSTIQPSSPGGSWCKKLMKTNKIINEKQNEKTNNRNNKKNNKKTELEKQRKIVCTQSKYSVYETGGPLVVTHMCDLSTAPVRPLCGPCAALVGPERSLGDDCATLCIKKIGSSLALGIARWRAPLASLQSLL